VADDGTIAIASSDPLKVEAAIKMIKNLTAEAEVGKIYTGTVRKIVEFGAFVEIFPGTDGLVHISELSDKRVKSVSDVLAEGDEVMVKVISVDRAGKIRQERIKDVIGPGGKVIKDITARTGCSININDDGTINIASPNQTNVDAAIKMIKNLTQEADVGKTYLGTVRKIAEFGAFVEIFPGTDGLIHISELSDKRVKSVSDVLQEGEEVLVKVISVDRAGKIRLSRKEALADAAAQKTEPPKA
jgi:polyribonucleotide nucleotidyltransferase